MTKIKEIVLGAFAFVVSLLGLVFLVRNNHIKVVQWEKEKEEARGKLEDLKKEEKAIETALTQLAEEENSLRKELEEEKTHRLEESIAFFKRRLEK